MKKTLYLVLFFFFFLPGCAKKQIVSPKDSLPSEQENFQPQLNKSKAAKLNVQLGLSYLKEGQISRAKSKLNRALALAPDLPEVHYAYGYFFEQIGETERAEKSYLKAIALNPKGGIEHNNYGAFLCRQKQYKQAENEFLIAVNDWQYTHTAQAFENAGMCLLQIPDKKGARIYFEKALRHDPKSPNALLELAQLNLERRDFVKAKQYLLQYQQHFSSDPRSLLLEKKLYSN